MCIVSMLVVYTYRISWIRYPEAVGYVGQCLTSFIHMSTLKMSLRFSAEDKRRIIRFETALASGRPLSNQMHDSDNIRNAVLLIALSPPTDVGPFFLMVRDAKRPTIHKFPGGAVDRGESPLMAALREFAEEALQAPPPMYFNSEVPWVDIMHKNGTATRIFVVSSIPHEVPPYGDPSPLFESFNFGYMNGPETSAVASISEQSIVPGTYGTLSTPPVELRSFELRSFKQVVRIMKLPYEENYTVRFSLFEQV